jgi:D-sedoheptulose 7-phosphate isomerase
MNERDDILRSFENHSDLIKKTFDLHSDNILKAADLIVLSFLSGGKLVAFGNGGSAADSQHFVAEFIGKFLAVRKSLPALALTSNTSTITAVGNDYGFEHVFERQVESLVNMKDIIIAISTSGNSENVVNGVKAAKKIGAKVIALTGEGGGKLSELADLIIDVPSIDTPRIQEAHIFVEHLVCGLVEKKILQL